MKYNISTILEPLRRTISVLKKSPSFKNPNTPEGSILLTFKNLQARLRDGEELAMDVVFMPFLNLLTLDRNSSYSLFALDTLHDIVKSPLFHFPRDYKAVELIVNTFLRYEFVEATKEIDYFLNFQHLKIFQSLSETIPSLACTPLAWSILSFCFKALEMTGESWQTLSIQDLAQTTVLHLTSRIIDASLALSLSPFEEKDGEAGISTSAGPSPLGASPLSQSEGLAAYQYYTLATVEVTSSEPSIASETNSSSSEGLSLSVPESSSMPSTSAEKTFKKQKIIHNLSVYFARKNLSLLLEYISSAVRYSVIDLAQANESSNLSTAGLISDANTSEGGEFEIVFRDEEFASAYGFGLKNPASLYYKSLRIGRFGGITDKNSSRPSVPASFSITEASLKKAQEDEEKEKQNTTAGSGSTGTSNSGSYSSFSSSSYSSSKQQEDVPLPPSPAWQNLQGHLESYSRYISFLLHLFQFFWLKSSKSLGGRGLLVLSSDSLLEGVLHGELFYYLTLLGSNFYILPSQILESLLGLYHIIYMNRGEFFQLFLEQFFVHVYIKGLRLLCQLFANDLSQQEHPVSELFCLNNDPSACGYDAASYLLGLLGKEVSSVQTGGVSCSGGPGVPPLHQSLVSSLSSTHYCSSISTASPVLLEVLETLLDSLTDLVSDLSFLPAFFASFDCSLTGPNLVQTVVDLLSRTSSVIITSGVDTFGQNKDLSNTLLALQRQILSSFSSRCSSSVLLKSPPKSTSTSPISLNAPPALQPPAFTQPEGTSIVSQAPSLHFSAMRNLKNSFSYAAKLFSVKPRQCFQYLQSEGIFSTPLCVNEVVWFLKNEKNLQKNEVGAFLGELGTATKDSKDDKAPGKAVYEGDSQEFHQLLLLKYVESFNLRDLSILDSLRIFLNSFRLPGEAQQIDRILEAFSSYCFSQCLEKKLGLVENSDITFILLFSIIMLNTDRHNKNLKKDRRMGLSQYIDNNTFYGRDAKQTRKLPVFYLKSIYLSINSHQLSTLGVTSSSGFLTAEEWKMLAGARKNSPLENILYSSKHDDTCVEFFYQLVYGEREREERERLACQHNKISSQNMSTFTHLPLLSSFISSSSPTWATNPSSLMYNAHLPFVRYYYLLLTRDQKISFLDEEIISVLGYLFMLPFLSLFYYNYRVIQKELYINSNMLKKSTTKSPSSNSLTSNSSSFYMNKNSEEVYSYLYAIPTSLSSSSATSPLHHHLGLVSASTFMNTSGAWKERNGRLFELATTFFQQFIDVLNRIQYRKPEEQASSESNSAEEGGLFELQQHPLVDWVFIIIMELLGLADTCYHIYYMLLVANPSHRVSLRLNNEEESEEKRKAESSTSGNLSGHSGQHNSGEIEDSGKSDEFLLVVRSCGIYGPDYETLRRLKSLKYSMLLKMFIYGEKSKTGQRVVDHEYVKRGFLLSHSLTASTTSPVGGSASVLSFSPAAPSPVSPLASFCYTFSPHENFSQRILYSSNRRLLTIYFNSLINIVKEGEGSFKLWEAFLLPFIVLRDIKALPYNMVKMENTNFSTSSSPLSGDLHAPSATGESWASIVSNSSSGAGAFYGSHSAFFDIIPLNIYNNFELKVKNFDRHVGEQQQIFYDKSATGSSTSITHQTVSNHYEEKPQRSTSSFFRLSEVLFGSTIPAPSSPSNYASSTASKSLTLSYRLSPLLLKHNKVSSSWFSGYEKVFKKVDEQDELNEERERTVVRDLLTSSSTISTFFIETKFMTDSQLTSFISSIIELLQFSIEKPSSSHSASSVTSASISSQVGNSGSIASSVYPPLPVSPPLLPRTKSLCKNLTPYHSLTDNLFDKLLIKTSLSQSSKAWLEIVLVELVLRNRDRFSLIWPLIRDHYQKTLSPASHSSSSIQGGSTLSYPTERRVVGLLTIANRLIARSNRNNNFKEELLELFNLIFLSSSSSSSSTSPSSACIIDIINSANSSSINSLLVFQEKIDQVLLSSSNPSASPSPLLLAYSDQIVAGLWHLLTNNSDHFMDLSTTQWDVVIKMITLLMNKKKRKRRTSKEDLDRDDADDEEEEDKDYEKVSHPSSSSLFSSSNLKKSSDFSSLKSLECLSWLAQDSHLEDTVPFPALFKGILFFFFSSMAQEKNVIVLGALHLMYFLNNKMKKNLFKSLMVYIEDRNKTDEYLRSAHENHQASLRTQLNTSEKIKHILSLSRSDLNILSFNHFYDKLILFDDSQTNFYEDIISNHPEFLKHTHNFSQDFYSKIDSSTSRDPEEKEDSNKLVISYFLKYYLPLLESFACLIVNQKINNYNRKLALKFLLLCLNDNFLLFFSSASILNLFFLRVLLPIFSSLSVNLLHINNNMNKQENSEENLLKTKRYIKNLLSKMNLNTRQSPSDTTESSTAEEDPLAEEDLEEDLQTSEDLLRSLSSENLASVKPKLQKDKEIESEEVMSEADHEPIDFYLLLKLIKFLTSFFSKHVQKLSQSVTFNLTFLNFVETLSTLIFTYNNHLKQHNFYSKQLLEQKMKKSSHLFASASASASASSAAANFTSNFSTLSSTSTSDSVSSSSATSESSLPSPFLVEASNKEFLEFIETYSHSSHDLLVYTLFSYTCQRLEKVVLALDHDQVRVSEYDNSSGRVRGGVSQTRPLLLQSAIDSIESLAVTLGLPPSSASVSSLPVPPLSPDSKPLVPPPGFEEASDKTIQEIEAISRILSLWKKRLQA